MHFHWLASIACCWPNSIWFRHVCLICYVDAAVQPVYHYLSDDDSIVLLLSSNRLVHHSIDWLQIFSSQNQLNWIVRLMQMFIANVNKNECQCASWCEKKWIDKQIILKLNTFRIQKNRIIAIGKLKKKLKRRIFKQQQNKFEIKNVNYHY